MPNLQPGVAYHYRIVASNEDGTSYGADQTLTTHGYPVSAIQMTPPLATKLGFFNPETGHSTSPSGKAKGHRKSKARKRRKSKRSKKK